ncbi:MAG: hypothetical protein HN348_10105 [Proteobacteria bacterium]|jgi:hypothetical protein|nr:hypothetical protein [Pseudomonadota bacterium]
MFNRGIGRREVGIGVAVVVVLVLIAIPFGMSASKKSKRNEVRDNVESLRIVEIEHRDAFGVFVTAKPAPRGPTEVTGEEIQWVPTEGFNSLSWAPKQEFVRASYAVVATGDGFKVIGTSDIDGDGKRAVIEATLDGEAHLVTDEGIY